MRMNPMLLEDTSFDFAHTRSGSNAGSWTVERRVHAGHLLRGEHEHCGVVHVVHVVHEHIAVRPVAAGDMGELGLPVIRKLRIRRVTDEICSLAMGSVSPYVVKIQP